MTDKQIIIDGVDVSGCHNKTFYKNDEGDVQCKCYRFEDADSDTLLFGICKQHPNCYYKQLQRVDERNKELEDVEAFRLEELATLDDLRDENSKLKKELEQEKALKETYLVCYKAKHEDIEGKLFKFSTTIAEIKDIAERDKEFCIKCNGDKEIDCIDCIEGGRALLAKDILQKIKEVEDE